MDFHPLHKETAVDPLPHLVRELPPARVDPNPPEEPVARPVVALAGPRGPRREEAAAAAPEPEPVEIDLLDEEPAKPRKRPSRASRKNASSATKPTRPTIDPDSLLAPSLRR